MKISQPYFFNEIGKRLNQEDSVYPIHPSNDDKIFMVCDGIGGHEHGEVASKVVCDSISSFFKTINKEDFSVQMFKRALAFAYDELDKKDETSEKKGAMGTTLTFLYLAKNKAYVAHIGDSRVYHLRTAEGQSYIVHKTFDHSLVNVLLRDGIITEDEAIGHPNKNIITRAMQPLPVKRSEADIYMCDDLLPGDYFFLCSDGVLESITDDSLLEILSEEISDEDKLEKIRQLCKDNSKDNNSAYLIHIEDVEKEEAHDIESAEMIYGHKNAPKRCKSSNVNIAPKKKKKLWPKLLIGLLVVSAIFFAVKKYDLISLLIEKFSK